MKKSILIIFCLISFSKAFSIDIETDSIRKENSDTVLILKPINKPRRATMLSLVLPGAGQFYNKSYWKMPIVYAGFGALAFFIRSNHIEYRKFSDDYNAAADTSAGTIPINYPFLSAQSLKANRDFHKKNRDLSIIGCVFWYGLQILDANVDAHLKEFDLDDNLSLKIDPTINYNVFNGSFYNELSITFRF